MKLKDLGKVVDGIAPLKLALDWDNVGLLIGSEEAEVKKVLLTIDVTKATEDRVAVIPFSLKNEDFNLSAQLKIFNQQDRVYLEFESYIDEIEVSKINQNLPSALANTAAALWLDQVIDKGFLTDISLGGLVERREVQQVSARQEKLEIDARERIAQEQAIPVSQVG